MFSLSTNFKIDVRRFKVSAALFWAKKKQSWARSPTGPTCSEIANTPKSQLENSWTPARAGWTSFSVGFLDSPQNVSSSESQVTAPLFVLLKGGFVGLAHQHSLGCWCHADSSPEHQVFEKAVAYTTQKMGCTPKHLGLEISWNNGKRPLPATVPGTAWSMEKFEALASEQLGKRLIVVARMKYGHRI